MNVTRATHKLSVHSLKSLKGRDTQNLKVSALIHRQKCLLVVGFQSKKKKKSKTKEAELELKV